jgi:hypothetical protein
VDGTEGRALAEAAGAIVARLSRAERRAVASRLAQWQTLSKARLVVFEDVLAYIVGALRDGRPTAETNELRGIVEALRDCLADAVERRAETMKNGKLCAGAELVSPPSAVTASAKIILRARCDAVAPGSAT